LFASKKSGIASDFGFNFAEPSLAAFVFVAGFSVAAAAEAFADAAGAACSAVDIGAVSPALDFVAVGAAVGEASACFADWAESGSARAKIAVVRMSEIFRKWRI